MKKICFCKLMFNFNITLKPYKILIICSNCGFTNETCASTNLLGAHEKALMPS